MLDQVKLRRLKQTSTDGDWIAATDVALELSLESKGTKDEFCVEEMAMAVRRKDTEWLEFIINQLVAN